MKIITLVTAAGILGKVATIAAAIFFFGLLILFHEGGHFAFAKLFNVKVNEFAFGMGPTLWSKQKGETKYALHLFPIGGFCSMEGESESSESDRAYCNKPVWQRLIICAAGAVINIIMGFLIVVLMLCVTTGKDSGIGTPQVYYFQEDAVSCDSGLEEMDLITSINGKRVFTMTDISLLMTRDKDGVLDMTVRRDGKKVVLDNVRFDTYEEDGQNLIVLDFIFRGVKVNFLTVMKYSFLETVSYVRLVWLSFFDLITGTYGVSDLSGPIGTVAYVAEAAEESVKSMDWSYVLFIMALIAVNIGVFNLFPLPALDGGRIFFMLIEIVFRKPVPAKYENLVHAIGLIILLIFMALISVSDIIKLATGQI